MTRSPRPAPGPSSGSGSGSGAGEAEAQARLDAQLTALMEGLPPHAAAQLLAALLSRAATRLHTLARAEAAARKGQPDWPAWAALQNAARSTLLQCSTCRDLARRLPSASESESEAASPTAPADRAEQEKNAERDA